MNNGDGVGDSISGERRSFLRVVGAGSVVGASSLLAGCGSGSDGGDGGDGGGSDGGDGGDGGGSDGGDGMDGGDGGDGGDGDGGDGGGGPTPGGTLVSLWQSDILTATGNFAPQTAGGNEPMIAMMIYGDTLIQMTPAGDYQPMLATDWGYEDDSTFVVTLREGVQFHPPYDREMKAVDVVENIKQYLTPGYGGVGRGNWVPYVVGADETPSDQIEETGEYEVTFHLQSAMPHIADALAYPRMPIYPLESREEHGDQLGTAEVGVWGTGPFMFDSAEANNYYRWKKNPNYWMTDDDGNALPYLDELDIRVVPEGSARTSGILAGDYEHGKILATDVGRAEDADGVNVKVIGGTRRENLYLNGIHWEPADDLHLRRALAYAISNEAINEAAFNGQGVPANGAAGPLPPGHTLLDSVNDDNVMSYGPGIQAEKAQAAVEEAAIDLPDFEMLTLPNEKHVKSGTVAQQNIMSALDVEVTVNTTPRASGWGEWIDKWDTDPMGPPAEDDTSMDDYATSGQHPFWHLVEQYKSGSYGNLWYFQDSEFDSLADQAVSATSPEQQTQLFAQCCEMLTRKMPAPYNVWQPQIEAWADYVHGVEIYPTIGRYYTGLWIEEGAQ